MVQLKVEKKGVKIKRCLALFLFMLWWLGWLEYVV